MVFGDYQPHGLAFYGDARHLLACAAYQNRGNSMTDRRKEGEA